MKNLFKRVCIACFFIPLLSTAQKNVRLASPDGRLVFGFFVKNNAAFYDVSFKNQPLIEHSTLRLEFDNGMFGDNIKNGKPVFREADEDYQLFTGKAKKVHERFDEVIIPLQENSSSKKLNLVVRVFNDGLAFRYSIPQQENWNSFTLLDEHTTFRFAGNPVSHSLMFGNYTSSHEGIYNTVPFKEIKEDTLMDMPATFEFP